MSALVNEFTCKIANNYKTDQIKCTKKINLNFFLFNHTCKDGKEEEKGSGQEKVKEKEEAKGKRGEKGEGREKGKEKIM